MKNQSPVFKKMLSVSVDSIDYAKMKKIAIKDDKSLNKLFNYAIKDYIHKRNIGGDSEKVEEHN